MKLTATTHSQRQRFIKALGLAALLFGALLALRSSTGHARDAPHVLIVNMTPDAHSSEASRECVQRFVSGFRGHHDHIIHRQGETATRQEAGMTDGQPFVEWSKQALARVGDRDVHEFVILVDCRPERQTFDLRMSDGLFLELRAQPLTQSLLRSVAAIVRQQLWHTA